MTEGGVRVLTKKKNGLSGLTASVTSGDQRRHGKVRCNAGQVFYFVIEPIVWVRFCMNDLMFS